ncbi:Hypothetical protein SRAE_1000109900 [Strongyloides ratti]|uniref:Uncharacterized protein n=1 Tax=Strongyloides ratti TaxID=34506 RepID=A0A090KZI1_STRRB|nr:Hypothetical protein SRAE_1000109900 [Strongyloides ratti]CEF62831.1 Hypothetical protein SRAE_1000109900 [Strongyloides ratti]
MQCVEQLFFCKNTCSKKNREQFLAKDEIDCFRANITGGDVTNKYPSSEHKSLKAPHFGGNRTPVQSSFSYTPEIATKSITSNIKGLYGSSNKQSTKSSNNILLKQALANRINHPQLNEGSSKDNTSGSNDNKKNNEKGNDIEMSQQPDELIIKCDEVKNNKIVGRKISDEMSSSILLSPAWYRDSEGKTGIKEKEWEKLPNQQKCPIKHKKEDKTKNDKQNYEIENIYESIKNDFQPTTLSDKNDKHKNKNKLKIKNDEKNGNLESEGGEGIQNVEINEYLHTIPSTSDNFKNNRRISDNSDHSKLSSMSRKSVTFSDQVVINEISRRLDVDKQIDFKIGEHFDDSVDSEEDIPSTLTAVTIIKNNDELPPTHIDPSLEVSRELQKEFTEYNNDNVFSKQPFLLGPNVEKSIYFDETLGANVYLLEDNSSEDEYLFDSASLNLPESVKRALRAEALARKKDISNYERDITIGCLYGSMSRLHADDSPNLSLHDLCYSNTVSREGSYKKKIKEKSINDRAYDGEAGECSKLTTEIGDNFILENNEIPIEDNKNKQSKSIKYEKLMEEKKNKDYNISPSNLLPSSHKKEYKKNRKKTINDTSEEGLSTSPDSEYDYNRRLSTIAGSPNPSHISKVSNKSSLSYNAQKPPPGNISPSRSNSITSSNSVKKQNDTLNDNDSQTKHNHPKPFIRSASGYFEPPDLSKQIIHHVEVGDTKSITISEDNDGGECKNITNVIKRIPKPLPPKEPGGESIQRSYYDNVSYGGVFTPPENLTNKKVIISSKNKINDNKELKLPRLSIVVTDEDSQTKDSELEEIYKEKFMNMYSKRKAPLVIEESQEIAPKDPDHSYNYGLGPDSNRERKGSMTSNSSRESVISATSYKAEIKVRRNFNY